MPSLRWTGITFALAVASPVVVHADEPVAETPIVDKPVARPPAGSFEVGAGFTTDDGFLARVGVRHDDLFGSGQRLALTAELSARGQEARVRHEVPDLTAGLSLTTELFARQRQYPGFVREGVGGAVTVGHQLDRATRAFVRYRAEHVTLAPDPGAPPLAMARAGGRPALGDGLIASLGAGLAYDTRDAPLWPTRGTRAEVFADVADRRLGSDRDLLTVGAALEHARPLGPLVLRLSGSATAIRSRDGGPVPLSERLQHDGHADLRGYPLGALGSRDREASGRVELELPISRKLGLSIAGFAEAGVAYNADPTWGPVGATVARSVGASILWRSPIGPLRFDWAIPLDGDDRGAPQFGFGAGSDF